MQRGRQLPGARRVRCGPGRRHETRSPAADGGRERPGNVRGALLRRRTCRTRRSCTAAESRSREPGRGLRVPGQRWALAGLGEYHARLGNYDLARGYARQALETDPATGDPTTLAFAWHALGFAHARLGEHPQAISCYRQALALVWERKNPLARMLLVRLLAESGDACQATGDLPAAAHAWQQALQILHDLGWPDNLAVRARLEQAGPPIPPGSS
jgi:Tetratricopeptide repeat